LFRIIDKTLGLHWYRYSYSYRQYWLLAKNMCDWIWQNLASTHRAMLGDTAISSIDCIIASWWIMLKKWKSQQVVVYSLAIIVWVNNFQTPEIQWAALFVTVMILQVMVIGVVGGWGEEGKLNIGVQNGIRRQLKARGPVWGPTGPFLCLQPSKLKITDIGQPFVVCPAFQAPIQESRDHLRHQSATRGLHRVREKLPQKPDSWHWSKASSGIW